MKGSRLSAAAAGIGLALMLSGCSFSGSVNSVMGTVTSTSKETVTAASSEEGVPVSAVKFDDSIPAPAFSSDFSGTTNVVQNGQAVLQCTAVSQDGGTVTYQWYSNTVASNGGGTRIEGATGDTYSAPTSDGGTVYYYVTATEERNGGINETVSAVHAVTVWADMYWQQNADNGGYQYLNHDDGSYPSNTSMDIDGVTYTFNENGFAVDPSTGGLIDITTGEAAAPSADAAASSAEAAPAETSSAASSTGG